MEEEEATPKTLEILPVALVHDILHRGITSAGHPDILAGVSTNKNTKKYAPKNRKFKKEAIASLNRVSSLFVLYITTIAYNIAKANKRSTVVERDVMEALRTCMFWEIERQIINEQNFKEGEEDSEIDNAQANGMEMEDVQEAEDIEHPEEMDIDIQEDNNEV